MVTFNLKKEWFEKIKSGEKTHEYREVSMQYMSDLEIKMIKYFGIAPAEALPIERPYKVWLKDKPICFVLDDTEEKQYAMAKWLNIVNGKSTDLKIDKLVYDIEFEVIK